ncbi:protein kinase domain-containing protein [Oceanibaculum nanhaiense]|uniref:protein kinase domain-containing protein n=1 Tax=Oceanibaculum nanhaiense TaxID=1909734 RepID=UPI00396E7C97
MLVDAATGLPVALGAVLAEGGEGRLCATDRPGLVAKLYHRPVPERAVKLAALLLHPARSVAGVAWPVSALRDEAGRTIGFLMPRIEDAQPLTVLANARLRLAQAPGFTWYHLHVAARRLANLVGRLHAAEITVGDLKPENLLVDAKARITLIDADSVQFTLAGQMHRCAVGAEGFVAPELVGQDLAAIDRDQSHDRFALGVLIHTLLLGHHPFAGLWQGPGQGAGDPPALDGLVRAGHYPGLAVSPQRPGPFAVTPNALHPALRGLVRRCFVDGHRQPAARPAPAEWVAALDTALGDLVLCAEEPGHFRAASSGPCPWCARRADLGIDSFADSEAARELMADGLRKALEAGDPMRQAFLWSHHPLLWQHADFAGEAARLGRMAAALPAVERLRSVLARTPDDAEALVAAWRRMPDLGDNPLDNPLANPLVAALTLPDGRPVAQAVAEAEGRLDRLRQLRASFAAGPPTPESAPALVAAYRLAADAFGADSRFLRPYARRAEAAASLLAETAFSGKA